jgi:hypothetical protein
MREVSIIKSFPAEGHDPQMRVASAKAVKHSSREGGWWIIDDPAVLTPSISTPFPQAAGRDVSWECASHQGTGHQAGQGKFKLGDHGGKDSRFKSTLHEPLARRQKADIGATPPEAAASDRPLV